MPWFKIDDGFYDNPKVKAIPRRTRMACLGLWVSAGTWSAKHLTDGRIPTYMVDEFGAEVSHGDTLVACGLWRLDGDEYVFHDWHDWQPSRVDTLASREKERVRKEAYRARMAGNTGQSPDGTQTDGANASGDPDPTRPDPTRTPSKEGEEPLSPRERDDHPKGSLIPPEWRPNEKHIGLANSLNVDVDREQSRFRAHAQKNARRMKKWDQGFTNWLNKSAVFAQQRNGQSQPKTFAQQKQSNALALVNKYQQEEEHEEIGNGQAAHLRALDSGRGA